MGSVEVVIMELTKLDSLPKMDLPSGYSIRNFDSDNNDEKIWAEIEIAVNGFSNTESALEKFQSWTNEFPGEIQDRCFFLVDDSTGKDIGTITAWKGLGEFEGYGRIHWLAIIPEFQNRGLGKFLFSYALNTLKQDHNRLYLKTDQSKQNAISLYKSFGFKIIQVQPQ